MMREVVRYTLNQRLLHWTVALLVILSLIGGALLWSYGFEGLKNNFGMETTNFIYKYHKTSGVLILAMMLLRLMLRLTVGAPAPAASLTDFERNASQLVHWFLYAALIAMPIAGWLATAAGGFPIEFFNTTLPPLIGKDQALSGTLYVVHGLLGLVILGLITIHIAAALRHRFVKRDEVMQRMSLLR